MRRRGLRSSFQGNIYTHTHTCIHNIGHLGYIGVGRGLGSGFWALCKLRGIWRA